MKKRYLPLLFAIGILSLVIATGLVLAEKDRTTLNGTYNWGGRDSGDLKAVFTETGPGQYLVSFHFEFRSSDHTYSGTAEGSLEDGALSGEVQNEARHRSFSFEGEFKGGKFRGTHAETSGGQAKDTGTMTLK